jgi:hypothetical protein
MKYRLEELSWQEFEILAFKCLQKIVSPGVSFLHGGHDKGRDILYTGESAYNKNFTGKWIFQAKHNSNPGDKRKAESHLNSELASELTKVFITNQLDPNVYILVSNLPITPALFDLLHNTFTSFCQTHKMDGKQFDIIGYHHLETCIEENDVIKWNFPTILSAIDLQFLLNKVVNAPLGTRVKGWLNVIKESYRWFIATQSFNDAMEKLIKQHIILLSGPPKSGKTFIAEILALLLMIQNDYEPVRIDDAEEFERFYNSEKRQLFVCDDAFGKHRLSASNADEWERKLYSIFTLADETHKLVFTSRENVYRAFIAFATIDSQQHLNKIIVDASHLTSIEKEALLTRYILNAAITTAHKDELLYDLDVLTTHKNFSPESVRSFFSDPNVANDGKSIRFRLIEHFNNPDEYLGHVFQNLNDENKIVMMSVLCAEDAAVRNIGYTYENLVKDLSGKKIISFNVVLDELDGSILRITRSDINTEVSFHHPSMQEFLIHFFSKEMYGPLRIAIIKNVNNLLLTSSLIHSNKLPGIDKKLIAIEKKDLVYLEQGIYRMLANPNLKMNWLTKMISWLSNAGMGQIPMMRLLDRELFVETKKISTDIFLSLNDREIFSKLEIENCEQWADMLGKMQTLCTTMAMDMKQLSVNYAAQLLSAKQDEPGFSNLVLRLNMFVPADDLLRLLGKSWFNDFYVELRNELYSLGYEIYGDDYPDFKRFNALPIAERLKLEDGKIINKPSKTWYPRFLVCKEKMQLLKNVQHDEIGRRFLPNLMKLYGQLVLSSQYAKNRYLFLIQKGWWKEDEGSN